MYAKFIAAAALMVITGTPAASYAQDAQPKEPPKELTVGQVISITAAIGNLSPQLTPGAAPVPAAERFHFTGSVTMTLALNFARGQEIAKAYNEAAVALRIKLADGPGKDVPKEKLDDYVAQLSSMQEAKAGLSLGRIKLSDLCLDAAPPACPQKNDIPIPTVSALLPILDTDAK